MDFIGNCVAILSMAIKLCKNTGGFDRSISCFDGRESTIQHTIFTPLKRSHLQCKVMNLISVPSTKDGLSFWDISTLASLICKTLKRSDCMLTSGKMAKLRTQIWTLETWWNMVFAANFHQGYTMHIYIYIILYYIIIYIHRFMLYTRMLSHPGCWWRVFFSIRLATLKEGKQSNPLSIYQPMIPWSRFGGSLI